MADAVVVDLGVGVEGEQVFGVAVAERLQGGQLAGQDGFVPHGQRDLVVLDIVAVDTDEVYLGRSAFADKYLLALAQQLLQRYTKKSYFLHYVAKTLNFYPLFAL